MSKKNIWAEQIEEILAHKMVPEITFRAEDEMIRTTRPRGRPRLLSEEAAGHFRHYLGTFRGQKSQPRCYKRGCRNKLRRDQSLCCSQECEGEVVREKLWVLFVTGQIKAGVRIINGVRKIRYVFPSRKV